MLHVSARINARTTLYKGNQLFSPVITFLYSPIVLQCQYKCRACLTNLAWSYQRHTKSKKKQEDDKVSRLTTTTVAVAKWPFSPVAGQDWVLVWVCFQCFSKVPHAMGVLHPDISAGNCRVTSKKEGRHLQQLQERAHAKDLPADALTFYKILGF